MGLDVNGIKLLLYAKSLGVDFSSIITIGRQSLILNQYDLILQLRNFGYQITENEVFDVFHKSGGYAENFLQYLGARVVHSVDYSDYEGATHLHDMNSFISDNLKGKFSLVIDGGSLEHIFNFPIAIKNCMEMVRLGGHYLGITPANNFMGHGFYQFSPELYFSVFSMDNGYELEKMIIFEDKRSTKYYLVRNPMELNKRVTLTNSISTYINVIAKKVKECEIFEKVPQQSDYVQIWNTHLIVNDNSSKLVRSGRRNNIILNMLVKRIPTALKLYIVEKVVWLKRFKTPFNKTIYEQIRLFENK